MRVENEDTRSSWVPIRRIDGKHMQRTDEWCKHPEYDVQDVGIDYELKLSIMCADENEEEFAKRLRHCTHYVLFAALHFCAHCCRLAL